MLSLVDSGLFSWSLANIDWISSFPNLHIIVHDIQLLLTPLLLDIILNDFS